MQKGNISVGLIAIIVLVIAVGGYFLMQNSDTNGEISKDINEDVPENDVELVNDVEMIENYVTYDGNNFNPSTITISEGESITFINNSESQGMWVAAAVHPTHESYSGTSLSEHCEDGGISSFDACGEFPPGDEWSFTFDQVGEWSYHNHVKAGDTGTVIVE